MMGQVNELKLQNQLLKERLETLKMFEVNRETLLVPSVSESSDTQIMKICGVVQNINPNHNSVGSVGFEVMKSSNSSLFIMVTSEEASDLIEIGIGLTPLKRFDQVK